MSCLITFIIAFNLGAFFMAMITFFKSDTNMENLRSQDKINLNHIEAL